MDTCLKISPQKMVTLFTCSFFSMYFPLFLYKKCHFWCTKNKTIDCMALVHITLFMWACQIRADYSIKISIWILVKRGTKVTKGGRVTKPLLLSIGLLGSNYFWVRFLTFLHWHFNGVPNYSTCIFQEIFFKNSY